MSRIVSSKMSTFIAGAALGVTLMFAIAAYAANGLRIASGVYGVLPGYGNASVVCTDAEGNILPNVTIQTTNVPLSDPTTGATGTGVTFTCP
ncbi:MAG TPA: hypothetical protein VJ725_25185 [Thermoanaerobaculia bacterium]|nr:hypothetical protein [Thermoanaerobaculia bacterium]